jgi:hypothetical protein
MGEHEIAHPTANNCAYWTHHVALKPLRHEKTIGGNSLTRLELFENGVPAPSSGRRQFYVSWRVCSFWVKVPRDLKLGQNTILNIDSHVATQIGLLTLLAAARLVN